MDHFLLCTCVLAAATMSMIYCQTLLAAKECKSDRVISEYATKMRQMEERIKELEEKDTNVDLHRSLIVLNNTDFFGGNGGQEFDDKPWWRYRKITGMRMECDDTNSVFVHSIHGIQMKYGDDWAPMRGIDENKVCGKFGKLLNYTFESDERITSINITYGKSYLTYVHMLAITTNKRMLDTCGNEEPGKDGKSVVLEGNRLEYISGRIGCVIDGLRFHWSNL